MPSLSPSKSDVANNITHKGNIVSNITPSTLTQIAYNPNTNIDTQKYRKSIESVSPKIGTTFFVANVTSLSSHTLEYLFTKQQNTDVLSIVETSIIPTEAHFYKQKFNYNKRKIYANNGVPSPLGGKAHGGEMHAVRKHLNSMPIDQQVYDSIAQQTNSILRIRAMTLRVQGMILLCINAYFMRVSVSNIFLTNKSRNKYIC